MDQLGPIRRRRQGEKIRGYPFQVRKRPDGRDRQTGRLRDRQGRGGAPGVLAGADQGNIGAGPAMAFVPVPIERGFGAGPMGSAASAVDRIFQFEVAVLAQAQDQVGQGGGIQDREDGHQREQGPSADTGQRKHGQKLLSEVPDHHGPGRITGEKPVIKIRKRAFKGRKPGGLAIFPASFKRIAHGSRRPYPPERVPVLISPKPIARPAAEPIPTPGADDFSGPL